MDHNAHKRAGERSGEYSREARDPGAALLLERDSLTRERARRMLEDEGFAVCAVADRALFESIARAVPFRLCVVGVPGPEAVPDVEAADLAPLLLLCPADDPSLETHLRVRFPEARVADRRLRDPSEVRRALDPGEAAPAEQTVPDSDPVRETFAPFGLSERQIQVLALALLGQSSAEIGRQLYVSEMTVRNHLHAIYERVGVSGRRELSGRFVRGLLAGNA
jgi:DNA-binding CsgD family transcriptional regulator